MKTPNLWQKLTAAFKRPVRKPPASSKGTAYDQAVDPRYKDLFSETASVYHKGKNHFKKRKKRKRTENKSRAINYRKAK